MVEPQRYFGNNVAKTASLIDTLQRAGVGRIVFSSTCAVYGTPERVPVGEDAPIHPESPYGESKAMTERVLGWYDRCLGLRSVSLRYFNAAGAWPDGSIGEDWTLTINLIPLLMKAVLERRGPLQVYGTDYPTPDGTAIRDYVHVVDLADADLKALEYLEGGGATTVLNLGTGVGSSVFEVLAAAERVTGRPVPHELVARRPGDPVALYADTARLGGGPGLDGRARPRRHPGVGVGVALDARRRVRGLRSAGGAGDRFQLGRMQAPRSGPSVAGGVVPGGSGAEGASRAWVRRTAGSARCSR